MLVALASLDVLCLPPRRAVHLIVRMSECASTKISLFSIHIKMVGGKGHGANSTGKATKELVMRMLKDAGIEHSDVQARTGSVISDGKDNEGGEHAWQYVYVSTFIC